MPPGDRERLEALESWIERLVDSQVPILVEGTNDRAALRELGVSNPIELINQGLPLVDLADLLGHRATHWIILTDRDRHGGTLARQLEGALRGCGATVDHDWRRQLFATARVREIEELLPYAKGLHERARPPGRRVRKHFASAHGRGHHP